MNNRLRDGTDTAAARLRAWFTVLLLFSFVTLALIDRILMGLLVDPIKAGLGLSDGQIGVLQGAAFAVFFVIGSIPVGWMVDRFSKRILLFSGVVVWSLATVLFGIVTSFTGLFVARGLLGFGQAVLQPAGWGMVAAIFPPHRLSFALSILSAGAQFGAASSYLLGGLLIAGTENSHSYVLPVIGTLAPWQTVFLCVGLPGLLLAFLIFAAPREDRASRHPPTETDAKELCHFVKENRWFLFYHFAGFSMISIIAYGTAAWLPTYMLRSFDMGIGRLGTTLGLLQPVGIIGVMTSGWLVDRAFKKGCDDAHLRHFVFVAGALALIGGLGFKLGSTTISIFTVFGIIQFLQPFSGISAALIQIATPVKFRGRISAAFIMCYNAIGMSLGPSAIIFLNENIIPSDRLGDAISLNYALFGSIAAMLLSLGRRHSKIAVRRNR